MKTIVNGKPFERDVAPRVLLIHFIRENLGLTGSKIGCEVGKCGACTVIVDGRAVKSCMMFAVQMDGKKITTVEGLRRPDGTLDPVQRAFWEKHGLQCGYCTPGMLISAHSLLESNDDPSENEIKNALSGNLCTCTGYVNIMEAVKLAAKMMREETK
ncbi:MAG: (2Fe-2S)-binding protein [Nitrososphaerales archaeon]